MSRVKIMKEVINELKSLYKNGIPKEEIIKKAKEKGIENSESLLNVFLNEERYCFC
jgi:mannitol-specific phosphotransferase system IIBC component